MSVGLCRTLHDAVCCPLGASSACATLSPARGMQAAGALDARSVEEVAAAEAALVGLIARAERIERGRAAKKQASPKPQKSLALRRPRPAIPCIHV